MDYPITIAGNDANMAIGIIIAILLVCVIVRSLGMEIKRADSVIYWVYSDESIERPWAVRIEDIEDGGENGNDIEITIYYDNTTMIFREKKFSDSGEFVESVCDKMTAVGIESITIGEYSNIRNSYERMINNDR